MKRALVFIVAVLLLLGAGFAGLTLTIDDSGPDAQFAIFCLITLPIISIFLLAVGIWGFKKKQPPTP